MHRNRIKAVFNYTFSANSTAQFNWTHSCEKFLKKKEKHTKQYSPHSRTKMYANMSPTITGLHHKKNLEDEKRMEKRSPWPQNTFRPLSIGLFPLVFRKAHTWSSRKTRSVKSEILTRAYYRPARIPQTVSHMCKSMWMNRDELDVTQNFTLSLIRGFLHLNDQRLEVVLQMHPLEYCVCWFCGALLILRCSCGLIWKKKFSCTENTGFLISLKFNHCRIVYWRFSLWKLLGFV